jgi:hypothetical protein
MEGEEIVVLIPFIHTTAMQRVRLHRAEDAGLWIESQTLIEMMLKSIRQATSPKSVAFFFPWHQITFVMSGMDKVSISEKSLGL